MFIVIYIRSFKNFSFYYFNKISLSLTHIVANLLFSNLEKFNLVVFRHSIHKYCLYFTRLVSANYPHLLFCGIFPGKIVQIKMAPYLLQVNIPIIALHYYFVQLLILNLSP